jgi:hypothetical protein
MDALDLARDLAIRNAGTLARERYQRYLDELNEHLRDASKILIDITAAERNKLDQQVVSGQFTKEETSDLRRRQARRGARPLALRRRILARRARLLPPGRRLEVRGRQEVSSEIAPTRGRSLPRDESGAWQSPPLLGSLLTGSASLIRKSPRSQKI